MIDERDFFAFQLVEAAFFLGDVLQDNVSGRPISAQEGEIPLEDRAVARLRTPIPHGDDRDLVNRGLLRERERNARGKWENVGGACGALAFQSLVTFDAAIGRVARVAFL